MKVIEQFPPCKFRKLKERVCCHGLKRQIQYCVEFKVRVIEECKTCKRREI